MSSAWCVEFPQDNVGQCLKLVGLPTERAASPGSNASNLVREVVVIIDNMITTAIIQKTAVDFESARNEFFPLYMRAMTAFGSLARIAVPKQSLEQISLGSLSEMEADFREHGEAAFGAELSERGLFTVWILRKIYDLAGEIESYEFTPATAKADEDKAREFLYNALWNKFHVDCLVKSMRAGMPIYPEVAHEIRDGLRAAVNAYAHIRQWADLRSPRPIVEFGSVDWTEEDEQSLADSMRDLEHQA